MMVSVVPHSWQTGGSGVTLMRGGDNGTGVMGAGQPVHGEEPEQGARSANIRAARPPLGSVPMLTSI